MGVQFGQHLSEGVGRALRDVKKNDTARDRLDWLELLGPRATESCDVTAYLLGGIENTHMYVRYFSVND